MSDSAIRNAMRRRDEIAAEINHAQKQIEELRKQLARVDQFIADYGLYSGEPTNASLGNVVIETPVFSVEVVKRRTTGNSDKRQVGRAAYEALTKADMPIPRPAMLVFLRSHGLTIEGANPETVLSTMLWRVRDEFGIIFIKGHGYWLRERPNALARYNPATQVPDDEPDFELADLNEADQDLSVG